MQSLPNYDVLYFLEWLNKQPICKEVSIHDLFFNEDYNNHLNSLIQRYVSYSQKKDINELSKDIAIYIKHYLQDEQFSDYVDRCHNSHDCWRLCPFHKYLDELDDIKNTKLFIAEQLEQSVREIFSNPDASKTLHLMHYMVPTNDSLSIFISFLEWYESFNKTKNEIPIFPLELIEQFIREKNYNKVDAQKYTQQLFELFDKSTLQQIKSSVINRFTPNYKLTKDINYLIDRYLNHNIYKCIILSTNHDASTKKFVKNRWEDLNELSSDFLDIYYAYKDLNKGSWASLIYPLDIKDATNLPAFSIWNTEICENIVFPVQNLNEEEKFKLMECIVDAIRNKYSLYEIKNKGMEKIEDMLNDKKIKNITKINIGDHNNITNSNLGVTNNGILINNAGDSSLISDLQSAIKKIENLTDITPEHKQSVNTIINESITALSNNNQQEIANCKATLKGLLMGIGKTSITILNILGSFASIASFYGLTI